MQQIINHELNTTILTMENIPKQNKPQTEQKLNTNNWYNSLSQINTKKIKKLKIKKIKNDKNYIKSVLGKGSFGTVQYIKVTNESIYPMLLKKSFNKSISSILSKKTRAELEFENNQKAGVESILHGRHGIIYKYKGEDLYKLLGKSITIFNGFLDTDKKCNLTLQLLEEVSLLHEKGLSHLDIKHDNIVINNSGVLSLIDFGSLVNSFKLSRLDLHRFISQGIVIKYMAPEILYGARVGYTCLIDSTKLDIWALGVVIYELFTESRLIDNNLKEELSFSVRLGDTTGLAKKIYGKIYKHKLSHKIPNNIKNLLSDMLMVTSTKRITAQKAIDDYFKEQIKLANKSLFGLRVEMDKYSNKLSKLLLQKQQDCHNKNAIEEIDQNIVHIKQILNNINDEISKKQ
jgi:serine/threonine protein kinase